MLPLDKAPPMIPSPGTKLPRPDTMLPADAWAKMTLGRSRIVLGIQGSIPIPDCKIPFFRRDADEHSNNVGTEREWEIILKFVTMDVRL